MHYYTDPATKYLPEHYEPYVRAGEGECGLVVAGGGGEGADYAWAGEGEFEDVPVFGDGERTRRCMRRR